ncbi:Virginiamycin B lyase [Candidatus Norongarragalina meridionalis]|nr:Virginiamycin B lyase [Candidatus Norongarragalina meridionalis]
MRCFIGDDLKGILFALAASLLLFGCLTPQPAPTPTPAVAPTATLSPTATPVITSPSPTASAAELGCIASGGTVTTANCCTSITEDFPNSCAIGACGCAPEYSHPIRICGCGDKCFNGTACVTLREGEGSETPAASSASSDRFVWIASKNSGKVAKLYEKNGTFAGFYAAGAVPVSIAVDADGNVWVADGSEGNGEVTKLDPNGALIGTYVTGTAHSRVALDPSGNVWVTDIGDKIEKLDPDGKVLGKFTTVMDPVDIIADKDGNVWVTGTATQSANGNLVRLDSDGSVTAAYNLQGSAGFMTLDSDGNLLVSGGTRGIVTRVGRTGGILGNYSFSAVGMAVDADGNLWATDAGNTVKKYDSGGTLLGEYSVGEYALGISVDFDGNVWVSNFESTFVTKLDGKTGALVGNYEVDGCEWNFGDAAGFRYRHFVLGTD